MKYLMFAVTHSDRSHETRNVPIIFPNELLHEEMAKCSLIHLRQTFPFVQAVSGGIYNPATGRCSGEVPKMNLRSNSLDARTIMQYDMRHGIR